MRPDSDEQKGVAIIVLRKQKKCFFFRFLWKL